LKRRRFAPKWNNVKPPSIRPVIAITTFLPMEVKMSLLIKVIFIIGSFYNVLKVIVRIKD